MNRIIALFIVGIGALVGSSTAFASATTCGHSATCGPGQGGTFTPPPGGAGTHLGTQISGVGTLPFTGLNLATFVAIAVLLVACGLVLRRMTHRQQ